MSSYECFVGFLQYMQDPKVRGQLLFPFSIVFDFSWSCKSHKPVSIFSTSGGPCGLEATLVQKKGKKKRIPTNKTMVVAVWWVLGSTPCDKIIT
jgi:hypothetical protein